LTQGELPDAINSLLAREEESTWREGNRQGNALRRQVRLMNQRREANGTIPEQFRAGLMFEAPSTRFCLPDLDRKPERPDRLNFEDLLRENAGIGRGERI